jgi:hypothetical protein
MDTSSFAELPITVIKCLLSLSAYQISYSFLDCKPVKWLLEPDSLFL